MLLYVLFGIITLDAMVSTYLFTHSNNPDGYWIEANPFLRWCIENIGLFPTMTLKVVVGLLLVLTLKKLVKLSPYKYVTENSVATVTITFYIGAYIYYF